MQLSEIYSNLEILQVILTTFGVLSTAFMVKMLYLHIFFTVDDDDIKPKDHLIDDFYETHIGEKR